MERGKERERSLQSSERGGGGGGGGRRRPASGVQGPPDPPAMPSPPLHPPCTLALTASLLPLAHGPHFPPRFLLPMLPKCSWPQAIHSSSFTASAEAVCTPTKCQKMSQ